MQKLQEKLQILHFGTFNLIYMADCRQGVVPQLYDHKNFPALQNGCTEKKHLSMYGGLNPGEGYLIEDYLKSALILVSLPAVTVTLPKLISPKLSCHALTS